MKTLWLATRNAHKVQELAELLPQDWNVKCGSDCSSWKEVEETGSTFLKNATLKAVSLSREVPDWVLADDSGLEVDALGGAPGVYSARYAGSKADDMANNRKLLEELAPFRAQGKPCAARFRCVLALARDGKLVQSFSGVCEGVIGTLTQGSHGFGYDPLFIPVGYEQSFGVLGPEIKSRISHRSKALAAFLDWAKSW